MINECVGDLDSTAIKGVFFPLDVIKDPLPFNPLLLD